VDIPLWWKAWPGCTLRASAFVMDIWFCGSDKPRANCASEPGGMVPTEAAEPLCWWPAWPCRCEGGDVVSLLSLRIRAFRDPSLDDARVVCGIQAVAEEDEGALGSRVSRVFESGRGRRVDGQVLMPVCLLF
jgi:hypothetical protein